jgi:polyisoprenoid-binding protein YceI
VDTAAKTVEFTVDVRNMQVLDPNLSADKRSQVQEKMLSPDVLDPDRYPEIAFRSTRVEQQSGGELSVSGNLMLHGQTQPINVRVVNTQLHYRQCSNRRNSGSRQSLLAEVRSKRRMR